MMTNTPDYPALVELASRLAGKDKKTCELALYCLNRQDKRLAKRDARIAELEDELKVAVAVHRNLNAQIVELVKK